MAQVALVAGASSGLGRAIARQLAADGYRTYAGARSFGAAVAGAKAPPEGCVPLALDVTDDASVAAAVAWVLAEAGKVDVLVNCAAILTLGACEEASDAELESVLATNVRGSARMVRAVLPAMRAQGGGRIVQLSSLNGRMAVPFQGAYTASKHALEGWCEALAMETRRFGIGVTLIEPGDCRGGSDAYRGHAMAASREDSPYQTYYEAAAGRIHRDESGGLDPTVVARAVSRSLQKRHAPARVVCARLDQRFALWLHGLLPGRFFYRIIEAYYKPGGRSA